MKKHFVCMALVCAMVLFGAGMSLAGNGNGYGNGSGSGNGAGNGTGPIHDIESGIPFEYTGTVDSCSKGGGLTLTTDTGDVVVLYGIGPDYYWESLDIGHPAVGDSLTAIGYTVDDKNIVTKIIIDDETEVLLRDEDGKPLWRGTKGKSAGNGRS